MLNTTKNNTNNKSPHRHVNKSEIVQRLIDRKWLRWEYISDVDLGILPFRIAKQCPFFPRRWVITDIGLTKREVIDNYEQRNKAEAS